MGEGISDYTKFAVDLRRHMWMDGVEMELRRLIWQIAVTGKYISAKIHESNRKLAGFQNIYGEDQLALDRGTDEILKNQLQFSGSVREYASEEQETVVTIGQGHEKYFITADPLDGSSLVDANLSIGTIIGIHQEAELRFSLTAQPLSLLLVLRTARSVQNDLVLLLRATDRWSIGNRTFLSLLGRRSPLQLPRTRSEYR